MIGDVMKLLKEIKESIIGLGRSKAAFTLSHAVASACNSDYGVSFLRISSGLDVQKTELVIRLLGITSEPDFSNQSQTEMLHWLEDNGYLLGACKVTE
tara:strand:- start:622 stop:915 length:294 start_codon:yes stop_codon:yes gene_type:complete